MALATAPPPLVIVHSPVAFTGVRHAAIAGSEMTLCGRRCEWWLREPRAFDGTAIGCKTCKGRVDDPAKPVR